MVHNHYQQPGGEDEVVAEETALLEEHGHRVVRYTAHNDAIQGMSNVAVAARTIWNRRSYRELRALIRREQPAVVHFHNVFPLISPSAYYAARAEGAAVVQTFHNYRLVCANSYLFRNGGPCESCVGRRFAWPAVVHACYRDSRAGSATVALMQSVHRAAGTWVRCIDAAIALTRFERDKLLTLGIPAERAHVKPNMVLPDPGPGGGGGDAIVFVGRLSPEKGVEPLLQAWQSHSVRSPLVIIGDGPMGPAVKRAQEEVDTIRWLGRQPRSAVLEQLGRARAAVVPSLCYETFGRVAVEAFARGTPVLASRLGAVAEVVDDGRTGLHFQPGDGADLAAKVQQLETLPAGALRRMREEARREYEEVYTPGANYTRILEIYGCAQARQRARAASTN